MRQLARSKQHIDRITLGFISGICHACRLRAIANSPLPYRTFSQSGRRFNDPNRLRSRLQVLQPAPIGFKGEPLYDEQAEYRQKYTEAKTWEGLDWIGGPRYIYEQTRLHRIREKGTFRGYAPPAKTRNEQEVYEAVRQALKEVLFLHALNQPLKLMKVLGEAHLLESQSCQETTILEENEPLERFQTVEERRKSAQLKEVLISEQRNKSWTDHVELIVDDNGVNYQLRFVDSENLDSALRLFGLEKDTLEAQGSFIEMFILRGSLGTSSYPDISERLSSHCEWEKLNVAALPVRFALSKRVFQLIGIRIKDNDLRNTLTAGQFLLHLKDTAKPKDPKVRDVLELNTSLKGLANVRIEGRRITSLDKERAVGRWKIIAKELLDRGLPVAGHS